MSNANGQTVFDFDHLIIGGAIAGAGTALLLLRENPEARIAIVEKSTVFKRRVGESTVEVSSAYLGRHLGLTDHLNREHIGKQGLRFHFGTERTIGVTQCGEIGPRYNVRLPGYQLDRSVLDEEVLRRAEAAGATVFRPAKVTDLELVAGGTQTIEIRPDGGEKQRLTARWVIDASGVASVIGRKLGLLTRNERHPVSSVWARFRNVRDWDALGAAGDHADWRRKVYGLRDPATNHLIGKGYWIWMIRLRTGDLSAGVVYDQRLVDFPSEGGTLGERLLGFIKEHPAGRELFAEAEFIERDVHARSSLAYSASQLMGDGWALVGDAAGFLDPFYSPGLDWVGFTTSATAALVAHKPEGAELASAIERHNADFKVSYERWFTALYEDKYYYMGDLELLDLAFRIDLSTYYLGVVARPLTGLKDGWTLPPFAHPHARPAYRLIRAINRSLAKIGRRRMERGRFGRRNHGTYRPFTSFEFNYTLPLRLLGLLARWRWLVFTEWLHGRTTKPPESSG